MTRALLLRHFTVNRKLIPVASPMALLILWLGLSGSSPAIAAGVLMGMLLFGLSILQEALDENLERFVLSLPISRKQYVKESYLTAATSLLMGQMIPFLALALAHTLFPNKFQGPQADDLAISGLFYCVLSVFIFALLPLRYALGGHKGLAVFSLALVIGVGLTFGSMGWEGTWETLGRLGSMFIVEPIYLIPGWLGSMSLGAASLWVSTRLFERRDLS